MYLDDVQYTKNDWRNRNRVKTAHGPTWLTVPVITSGRAAEDLRDATIADDSWPRRHGRTVELAYAKAPFVGLAEGLFEIWRDPPRMLLTLDVLVIEWCKAVLGLTTPTVFASSFDVTENDASARLVRLCKEVAADIFYEGAAGRGYLDPSPFDRAGIKVVFQDYRHPLYLQQHLSQGFVSHLSVLDLILNTGPDALAILSGQITSGPLPSLAIRHADEFRKGSSA